MKIVKYKKTTKNRYKILFDEGSEITLYEDVIIKNNLLLKHNIDLELLDTIIKENSKYEAYDKSLTYIEHKLRTEKEIRDYLEKLNFDNDLIDDTINKLKKEHFLDEEKYIEAFVNDKVNLSLWGPYKIKGVLNNLGIESDYIDTYLNSFDDKLWKSRLDKNISKRMNSLKNKSLYAIKEKLKNEMFNLGFDTDMINDSLNSISVDDSDSLKKEIIKAYNKYSKKYQGKELEYKIKSYLYSKGYRSDYDLDIEKL